MKKKCALFLLVSCCYVTSPGSSGESAPVYTDCGCRSWARWARSGCYTGRSAEKDITLELALDLRDLLQAGGRSIFDAR